MLLTLIIKLCRVGCRNSASEIPSSPFVVIEIAIAPMTIPIVSMPGNKFLKHALEWDYFVGVISFYLLTYFMWKKNK